MDTNDRRNGDERRTANDTADAEARERQRRLGDRRDSPRVPIKLLVRQVEVGGSFEEREGDLSLGGVFYKDQFLPEGRRLELRFRLPGLDDEIRCTGELLRVSGNENGIGAHVRFLELPFETERAIARFLDDHLTSA